MSSINTVVINAAGTGSRLGLNRPKSMIEIQGKTIIERQLEQLSDVENVIAVVGFRGRELADLIWQLRRDVTIAINHNYVNTGTAESFVIGSKIATSRVLSLDGDLLVKASDMTKFINASDDLIGVSRRQSKLPVLVGLQDSRAEEMGFEIESDFEWTGLLNIDRIKALKLGSSHVFEGLKEFLPMKATLINCCEIDEPEDILAAEIWLSELEVEP